MSGYERPTTVAEATRLLTDSEGSSPLSGGTDLGVEMRHGNSSPALLVDIKHIPDLAPSIECTDRTFHITANTVMTDLETNPLVRDRLPGLVEAAEVVGSVQIRNRATLAGNLANASPAADTPPILAALNASVLVDGPAGTRGIPVSDFFVGYRETALQRGELITSVRIPEPHRRASSAFLKLGVRRAMEISIVCVGASIELDDENRISSAGIGLGSVAERTIRVTGAEEVILGNTPSEELFASAGEVAGEESRPISDLRAGGDYRKAMVPVLVRRALTTACQRALEQT